MESIILDRELENSADSTPGPVIKDNRARARSAIILLWIMVGVNGLIFASSALQFKMWWNSFDEPVDLAVFEINYLRQSLLWWLSMLAMIVCAVFFIRWFRRAYNNLHLVDNSYLSYSEGWAAGAWFVPVLHWVRPYRIMREICEHTYEHAFRINSRYADSSKLISLSGWWWALWVISPVLSRSAWLMSNDTAVIKLLLLSTGMIMAAYAFQLISALLAISIIKKVSLAEQDLYEDARRIKQETLAENAVSYQIKP